MLEVVEAAPDEVDSLVELEAALFREDAGRHDPFADPTWPHREGRADLDALIASPEALVLAARRSGEVVGLLVGYVTSASATRHRVKYAILRTMYVAESTRREGAGSLLVEHFLSWARQQECVEAHVDHYEANATAAAFYERCGFAARSVSRALGL
jgi:GNAT superfamily N-acetyltransferase